MNNLLIPKTSVFEMTYECNHRCLFCSVPWENPRGDYKKMPELSAGEWKDCVDEVIGCGVRSIAFSGGEPLLKEGFEDIISYAKGKNVKEPVFDTAGELTHYKQRSPDLYVITNGELVDDRWAGVFKEHGCSMVVSLPGIEAFGELTGGDHQKALSAIRCLSGAGLDVVVSICVTKKNLPELFETISLGFLNGARQLLLNRFLQGGRGIDHAELCLTKEEITRMLDTAEEACLAANIKGSVGTELPKCAVEKEYKMMTVGTMCSGGVDFFAIDPSGMVRPCNHSPVRLGHYKDLISAVGTDYWQRFKCKDFLPHGCANCALSLNCDGGCREAAHITGGSLDSIDPLLYCL